jgi:3-deoxy-D-manno-octulosonic-acid transferase
LIEASGLRWARRTAPTNSGDAQAEVILLDSIGELRSVYSLCPIVFVGGSIATTGGHNILEPAAVGACVITGAHTFNFQLIVETFVKAGAIVQLPPLSDSEATEELANTILRLLADPVRRNELGAHARDLVNENRGATERTLQSLSALLSRPANAVEPTSSLSAPYAPIA